MGCERCSRTHPQRVAIMMLARQSSALGHSAPHLRSALSMYGALSEHMHAPCMKRERLDTTALHEAYQVAWPWDKLGMGCEQWVEANMM